MHNSNNQYVNINELSFKCVKAMYITNTNMNNNKEYRERSNTMIFMWSGKL